MSNRIAAVLVLSFGALACNDAPPSILDPEAVVDSDAGLPQACVHDDECAFGEQCVGGICTSVVDPVATPDGGGCHSNDDCVANVEACNLATGECQLIPGMCRDIADCPEGFLCVVDENRCVPAVADGGTPDCVDGDRIPCGRSKLGECRLGEQLCTNGVLGPCVGAIDPQQEVCNHRDDNCNGEVDETFDLDKDPSNCGDCGNRCSFTNAEALCVGGNCTLGACNPGFYDVNLDPADGCEYACNTTNNGIEQCDLADNDCDGAIDEGFDVDQDGVSVCQGDCDDGKATVKPGVTEACNGFDDNCDGKIDEGFDSDADSFTSCGTVSGGGTDPARADCDDTDKLINPSGTERCNGKDDDCNGQSDEGFGQQSCGVGACTNTIDRCQNGQLQTCTPKSVGTETCANLGTDDDCDGDAGELTDNVHLGDTCSTGLSGICAAGTRECSGGSLTCRQTNAAAAAESCGNGLDDDCDARVDEDPPCTCVVGATQPCYDGSAGCTWNGTTKTYSCVGTCAAGVQTCVTGGDGFPQWGTCGGAVTPVAESCGNQSSDNDCDGDAAELTDGVAPNSACTTGLSGICAAGTRQCVNGSVTCKQTNAAAAAESCGNGLDDDCDGNVDEDPPCTCVVGATQPCYDGSAGCTWNGTTKTYSCVGTCAAGVQTCVTGGDGFPQWGTCGGAVTPVAESCGNQSADNDCDGDAGELTDDVHAGDACSTGRSGICAAGTRQCVSGSVTCKQTSAAAAAESCGNGLDDDCDGNVDEDPPCTCVVGATQPCYDGSAGCTWNGTTKTYSCVGTCAAGVQTCVTGGDGFPQWGTCGGAVTPVAESCGNQSADNDCDGDAGELTDDVHAGDACSTGRSGICAAGTRQCVAGSLTCKQTNTAAAEESCGNGLDDDCDAKVDENPPCTCVVGATQPCYDASSGCTYDSTTKSYSCVGACAAGAQTCVAGSDGLPQWGACTGSVEPVAESCGNQGADNDCDGDSAELADGIAPNSACTTGQSGICAAGTRQCVSGSVTCKQTNAAAAAESCGNGLDDDCDGNVDEDPPCTCVVGATQPCYDGSAGCTWNGTTKTYSCVGTCAAGVQTCVTGSDGFPQWGSCGGAVTPVAESCGNQSADNDCDGDAAELTDGVAPNSACTTGLSGICAAGTRQCVSGSVTCRQTNAAAAAESCGNGLDDDCNGNVDEDPPCTCVVGATQPCYDGSAGCTWNGTTKTYSCVGTCAAGLQTCVTGGDGFPQWGSCGGAVTPVAESCGNQSADNDCDGDAGELTDEVHAGDACSTGRSGICAAGTRQCVSGSVTCKQTNAAAAAESCGNGLDDDCDGNVDEDPPCTCVVGATQPCYDGSAGCTWNGTTKTYSCVGTCAAGVQTCVTGGDGFPQWGTCGGAVTPVAESCGNQSADNDCDGDAAELADGIAPNSACTTGLNGVCAAGTNVCQSGALTCSQTTQATAEICDLKDNDCDGQVDDGLGSTTCGIGACERTVENCVNGVTRTCTAGPVGTETCNNLDDDCDGTVDDNLGTTTCGAGECTVTVQNCVNGTLQSCVAGSPTTEVCDGRDNNCNGTVDDVSPATLTCGTGACFASVQACVSGTSNVCAPGTPGTESCNGVDDDCDGTTDNNIAPGSCSTGRNGICAAGHLECNGGVQQCAQDVQATVESCGNNLDDDCDGSIDEGCGCVDVDNDGFTTCQNDCNDNDGAIKPGATESCDGKDNDCDGTIDEGFDADADLYTTCGTAPGGGLDPMLVDCDDGDEQSNPGITCDCASGCTINPPSGISSSQGDGKDNNCNGVTDETCGCSIADNDNDGFSGCQGDCSDNDATVSPGAPELCDGKNNDCNANTVENCDVGQPCGFSTTDDLCKDRLICATDIRTNKATCGSFCNFSLAGGGMGDGCRSGESCSASLVAASNDHLCTASGTTGTRGAGEICASDGECKSNNCYCDRWHNNGKTCLVTRYCADLCGNDRDYCSTSSTCVVRWSPDPLQPQYSFYTGYCYSNALNHEGTRLNGQACATGNVPPDCRWGDESCVNGKCAEPCCRNEDCPSTHFCDPRPVSRRVGTFSSGLGAATGMPVCMPRTSGGTRVAGAACTTNSDCLSQFCEVDTLGGKCVDLCCNDASCKNGTTCEFALVKKPNGDAQSMRVCVHTPLPQAPPSAANADLVWK